jgi:hypothetical protein
MKLMRRRRGRKNEWFDLNEILCEGDELSQENGERDIKAFPQDEVGGDGKQREAGTVEAGQNDGQLGGDVADASDDVEASIGERRQIGAEYLSNEDPDEVKHDGPNERVHRRVADGDYEPAIDRISAEY